MGVSTSILIRAQARGGKFLGPDIGYSFITVRDVASGRLLSQSVAAGDSGQLGTELPPNPSAGVVLTQTIRQRCETLTPNWLSATAGSPSPTAGFLATFELERPTLIEISVTNQHTTSAQMWIWPGAQLITEPGLVLEIAGLNVQLLEPNPSQPPAKGQPIAISVWVTMMCGCKIADGSAWPASEFEVNASLLDTGGNAVSSTALALETTSIFAGSLPYPVATGAYQLVVTAIQPSMSNTGGATLVLSL